MNEVRPSVALNCPLPTLDSDIVTMGHGSGGLLTHRLLESGVFTVLKNEHLNEQHDGAILNVPPRIAFSTDSYVVSPIFFPGGNIGDLAINGTLNDLAMCGAIPKHLSLAFILEEGLPMTDYWDILVTIRQACEKAGVSVVTGDTKVVENGKGDGIFINTSGIGYIHPNADIRMSRIRPYDKIIISNRIGEHGVAVLSMRNGLEFETAIRSDTRNLSLVVKHLLDELGPAIHFLRDPTRGGVATVLNEIARQSKLGIVLNEANLPVAEEVEGACEMLGLDPLYVANEGVFIALVDPTVCDQAMRILSGHSESEHAAVVGHVVSDPPGKVILDSLTGGKRVVNFLTGEQLPRIC